LLKDIYDERRRLVTEYSRAHCDTTHPVVLPPTSSQLAAIRVRRGHVQVHRLLFQVSK